MHSYDNNKYYGLNGHNSSSITPSSSGSRRDYVGSSTQSSDTEMDYGSLPPTRRRRESVVESFSVMGEDNDNNNRIPPPDSIPQPYKLTPSKRSHRNTSFAIMTELPICSRTPSPPSLANNNSGRVSPFRGRGFRPGASSRHTTPSTSPPPILAPSSNSNNNSNSSDSCIKNGHPTNSYNPSIADLSYYTNKLQNIDKSSKIPTPSRRNSQKQLLQTNDAFYTPSNQSASHNFHERKESPNQITPPDILSRSLSHLPVKPTIIRPIQSPRRAPGKPLFTQLSPIIGTPKMSPEVPKPAPLKSTRSAFVLLSGEDSSDSVKSPSRIPRSTSFNRLSKSTDNLSKTSRSTSRNPSPTRTSKNTSRNQSPSRTSRNQSPNKEINTNDKPPRVPKRNISTAKVPHISRATSMKNLSKAAKSTSPDKLYKLHAPKQTRTSNATKSTSRAPSPNRLNPQMQKSRAPSPNHINPPKQQNRASSPNRLNPQVQQSRSSSPNRLKPPKQQSRAPSPNRLKVPKEKPGRGVSPSRSKKEPKSPTKIPKSNSYRNVVSKIDSYNKVRVATTKPKVTPKPEENSKPKPEQSKPKLVSKPSEKSLYSRQTSKEDKKDVKLEKTNSQNLIKVPEPPNIENKPEKTPEETMEEELRAEEIHEVKPSALAEKLQEVSQSMGSNVVSVTTETVTVPLNIEVPTPQVPLAPVENLLTKTVNDKPLPDKVLSKTNTQKSLHLSPKAVPKHDTPVNNVTRTEVLNNNICNVFGAEVKEEDKKLEKLDKTGNNLEESKGNKTVIVSEKLKPIKIQVKEQGNNLDVQSGNMAASLAERSPSNGTLTGITPRSPSPNIVNAADSTTQNDDKIKLPFRTRVRNFFKPPYCTKCRRKKPKEKMVESETSKSPKSWMSCCKKQPTGDTEPIVKDSQRPSEVSNGSRVESITSDTNNRSCCMKFKDVICCSRKNKVRDLSSAPTGCCGKLKCWKKKEDDASWAERRDSILSEAPPKKCCPISRCWPFCRRPSTETASSTEPDSRRTSMLDKKKSLTPTTVAPEKKTPVLDESLVEHTSEMRGAIPVLPIPLAWFCLILNCILPGVGTVMSGLLCLCFGKPRFSVHDGARLRVGSFFINLIVGVSQLFCVLFCLVGWGWSIWWGIIMLKVARKYKKMKMNESSEETEQPPPAGQPNRNHRDVERGRT